MNGIFGFQGEYSWLSNFWPCRIEYMGLPYESTEAAYQAMKCPTNEERKQFVGISAKEAKALGKKIKLRSDWDDVKVNIMEELLREKFNIPELKQKLLATGDKYLEETNYWKDTFWGVCNGIGENILGQLLMQIREELRAQ